MADDLELANADVGNAGVIEQGDPSDAARAAQDIGLLPPSRLPASHQWDVLSGWVRADSDFSREWRAQAKYWWEFRAGDHWSAEDKALLQEQNRPHIVFNRVLAVLKAVAGMEINGRHEVSFMPRGSEDVAANVYLSGANQWMADETDAEDEESAAFEDTITTGMGWCEERMSYDDDPSGLYVEDAVDAREMYWDRTARKKNLKDARRMARKRRMPLSDAMRMFPGRSRIEIDAAWALDDGIDYPERSLEDKWRRDVSNVDVGYDDMAEVTVIHIQWIEYETYYIVADVAANERVELSESKYKMLMAKMEPFGIKLNSVKLTRKVYKHAFLGGQGVMLREAGPAPIKTKFSWNCITGELDKATGTWFGLVKVMRDPQMWANKWLSQILHIINSTAKGGVIAEKDAFDDQREAEDSYAQADQITWAASGALSNVNGQKIMEKPGAGKVDAFVGLLAFAVEAVPQVAGLNMELLGQRDINQPGVLEAMRKQAGMTVLATLFDSLRRFRKITGRGRLFFIQNFLSDGRLVRIVGQDGRPQAIPLALDKTAGTYDVVVADAPTSPNQREQNWAVIQPLLAAFKDQLMANPKVFALLLEYSPLPDRIVDAIKQMIDQQMNDPRALQQQEENRKLFVAAEVAKISKDQSAAELNNAKAGSSQATAMYDLAMAQNMVEDNLRQGRTEQAEMMVNMVRAAGEAHKAEADKMMAKVSAVKAIADARHSSAKAERERAGVAGDAEESAARADRERAAAHRERIGAVIDAVAGQAGAHKDAAAAEQHMASAEAHRANARKADRTPAPAAAGTK